MSSIEENALEIQLRSFAEALATTIDERTPYNGTHIRKVSEYVGILADYVNKQHEAGNCEEYFDAERKDKLMLAALLHDIGKMVIPLSVMNRATRLDKDILAIDERFQLIKACLKIEYLEKNIKKSEYKKKIAYVDDSLAFIHEIDGVGYLKDDAKTRVQEIAAKTFRNPDGKKKHYLTSRERDCLSIRRGTLTKEDRKTMESHVDMTEKILSKVAFTTKYAEVPRWASAHHELLDGSGYPKHLVAEELDFETRILTVADIFDALTATDRPYKKPMSRTKAITILRRIASEGKVEARLVEWLDEALPKEATEG